MKRRIKRVGGVPAMIAKNLLAALAFIGTLAAAREARATPDFPGMLDEDLKLSPGWVETKVDPPDGCHLCHVNGSQGGTPLTAFGTLMQNDGAVPYEASSTAEAALAAIQAMSPKAITDIENGTDPNSDPTALGGDPLPAYGCGSVAPGVPTGRADAIVLGAVVCVLQLARRSRPGRSRRR